jgi:hypothetical protein
LAKKYSNLSPYVYVANNPLLYVDRDGRVLKIYGTEASFNKLKALIDVEFGELIELKRDKNNVVTMHINVTEESSAQLEKLKKTETYKQLNAIIGDKGTTSLDLVDNVSNVTGGSFRGGELNGRQKLDVGDATKRKDWLISSGLGAVMHEIVEAYQDQVKNGSVKVADLAKWRVQFQKAHKVALEVQAKVDGFDKQFIN